MQLLDGLDIVVVNYRTPHDLRGFIKSLLKHPPSVDWHATIANVSPTPQDTTEAANALNDGAGRCSIETFPDNVGYARAVNHCVAGAPNPRRVVAVFNADTRITEGVLDECYTALIANADWGVVGPRQIDQRGRFTHAGIFGPDSAPAHRGWMQTDLSLYQDVLEAYSVSGSAYFVKREVWDELTQCPIYRAEFPEASGAFLPTPLFYEETWCSIHARHHGFKVMYYGVATMLHFWHGSIATHGGDQVIPQAKETFMRACRAHGFDHD